MLRKLLKPLSFIPAILIMCMIFHFSAQEGEESAQLSYKISYEIVETGAEIIGADFEPWEIDSLAVRFNGPLRKLAHMGEYFALAIAVSFPLYVYGLHGILLMLLAGAFCVLFSCGDEYHQSFVAGRAPAVRDVFIDSIGIFFGILIVRMIGWTGRMTIFRSPKKKSRQDGEDFHAQENLSRREKRDLEATQREAAANARYAGPNPAPYPNGAQPSPYGGNPYASYPGGPQAAPYAGYPQGGNPQGEPLSQTPWQNGQGYPYTNAPYQQTAPNGPYANDPQGSPYTNAGQPGPYPGEYLYDNAATSPSYSGRFPENPHPDGKHGQPGEGNPQSVGYYGQPHPYPPQTPQYLGEQDRTSDELSDDMPLSHLLKPKK